MTDIRPFKGLIYNRDKIRNLASVVCPPYDCITDKELDELYKRDNFNFVRVLLAKNQRKENKTLDRYASAKQTLREWLSKDIFINERKPGIYFYLQEFLFKGERKNRLGFIALMRLKDLGKGAIYPHEFTRQGPKDDRFAMLKSVKANLSPIFTLFSDDERQINWLFDKHVSNQEPIFNLTDNQGGKHKLWRLQDPKLIARLKFYMKGRSIFIADGHHRYEVACEYRNALLGRNPKNSKVKGSPFDYILTYFMDINSRGLTILPTHRLVKKTPKDVIKRLEEFFKIERVKDRLQLSFLLAKAGSIEHAFGLYLKGNFYLLRLKNEYIIGEVIKEDSYHYNRLDTVLLDKLIFKNIFCLSSADISFTQDEELAVKDVDKGLFKAAFFLFPTKIEQIKTIALNREKMPSKSTYFYPKLLSGLVVHKF